MVMADSEGSYLRFYHVKRRRSDTKTQYRRGVEVAADSVVVDHF